MVNVNAKKSLLYFVLMNTIWLLAALSFSGCRATVARGPIHTLQSEEYVIHRIQKGETPEGLAERFLKDKNKAWVIEQANPGLLLREKSLITIPLKDRNKGGIYKDEYQVVPILCYHQFGFDSRSSLNMPPGLFDRQMAFLKDNGYRTISLGQLVDFLEYKSSIPKQAILITIDDGYRNTYDQAYPILKKYGFKAILCVYGDFVNASKNAVTWGQLKEMMADGFEVASHTLSHANLTKKEPGEDDDAYVSRVQRELAGSKALIEERLGRKILAMTYPYGAYNETVVTLCEEAGYKLGFTVKPADNPFFTNPFLLGRNQILKRDFSYFKSKINTRKRVPL